MWQDFVSVVSEHIHSHSEDTQEDPAVRDLATKAWNALKRSAKAGARTTVSFNRWLIGSEFGCIASLVFRDGCAQSLYLVIIFTC